MGSLIEMEKRLDAATKEERLEALGQLIERYKSGDFKMPEKTIYVNNHIHTDYSFSPYTPTSAAYTAWKSGLQTAGIMDHDSMGGAKEFLQAGEILGMAVTVGFEMRCNMEKTPFNGMRINNPDQDSVAYLLAHGVPHQSIDAVQKWLAPFREKREIRNEKMTENIGKLLENTDITLDYKKDVRPISLAEQGGSVTERHILFALSNKIVAAKGKGEGTLDFLAKAFGIAPSGQSLAQLQDKDNQMYEYYLLGILKSSLVEHFYIPATDECPDVTDFIKFIKEVGGVPVYAYLGDVGESPTGDKKAQKFEDDYLDELISWIAGAGFNAVTYMPTRNTTEQAHRIAQLADKYSLFQISGEDINSPFQSFICKDLEKPEFKHLITTTWALIGHEKAASKDIEDGMFTPKTLKKLPTLEERIVYFGNMGRG